MKPYNKSIDELFRYFATNPKTGLSSAQVQDAYKKYGLNEIVASDDESWMYIFLRQFQNPLIYFLLLAAILMYFIGPDKHDAFIISGVLVFNACIGAIQEGRTRSILHALRKFVAAKILVVRDGNHILIKDNELVPGDIILLREGQRIGADARIIESHGIKVDESSLSGESTPVKKNDLLVVGDATLFEQYNMVFKGTYIVTGTGHAIVIATGTHTEIGKIQGTVAEAKIAIPLRQELDRLSYHIVIGIFGLCALLFTIGFMTDKPVRELLVMLTALFICVVPEGLPVVLTLVLVSGTYRMIKNNVLIKNLQAVEGLGRIDVIVIDKTGTLTRNEMMVSTICIDDTVLHVSGRGYFLDGSLSRNGTPVEAPIDQTPLWFMGAAALLLNNAEIIANEKQESFEIKGDPTEAALYVFARKIGIEKTALEQKYSKVYEIPFDSVYRYHAGFYRHGGQLIAFITGSPELIISRCQNVGEITHQALAHFLDDGLRVVAVAMKIISPDDEPSSGLDSASQFAAWQACVSGDMKFLGIYGIEDALRSGIKTIVEQVADAGLQVVMATGDHAKTALYIAKKTGIYRQGDIVLEGSEFNRMSDEELVACSKNISVCARVTPDQKIRLVKAFQASGMLVAMTGDGINDAPALALADIGVGMGRIGTEIAKQASDIILLDDSFESITKAIELGRHIFYTLRRVILYFFATNLGEVLIVLFAMLLGLPLPITAAQILWLNLITDGFLDIALSMEPQEGSLLGVRWRYRNKHLIDSALWGKAIFMAVPMGIGSLYVFLLYYESNLMLARTMTLLTMAMFQWFNAWSCRSTTKSVFQLGFFSNPWLLLATSFVFVLQLALLYLPFMQSLFKTVPLTQSQFLLAITVASSVLVLEELRKAFLRWRDNRASLN